MHVMPSRSVVEAGLVGGLTIAFGATVGAMATSSPLLVVVAAAVLAGALVFLVAPDKRVLCLAAYVAIQPLSVEKILYTAPPLWADLRGQEIILNGGDVVLVVLAGVMLFERRRDLRPSFVVDRTARLFALLAGWGTVSYLMHLLVLQDTFVTSGPIGILHLLRNLALVVVVGSAIRERSDLVWVAFAAAAMVAFESGLVLLSYATGQEYNFPRLLGLTTVGLQTYSGRGETLIRATGTLGVANQQALFQLFSALLLTGLLAVENGRVRLLAALAIGASLAAIVLTFSRTAWLCSVVTAAVLLVILVRRNALTPRLWLVGACAAMASAVVLGVFGQPVIDRLTRGDEGATGSRIRMMELARDLALHAPVLGVGPAEYVEAGLHLYPPGASTTTWLEPGESPIVPPLGRIELARAVVTGVGDISVPLSVHNKYLLTLAELGLVGLGLWLAIVFQSFRDAVRCSRARDPFLRAVGLGGIGICIVAALYMSFDLFADDKTMQVLLFPLIVVGAAARIATRSDAASTDRAPEHMRFGNTRSDAAA